MADEWDAAKEAGYQRQREREQGNDNGANTDYGADGGPQPVLPLATISIGARAHLPLEPRLFLDGHGFILISAVHVMTGDGGIGKTDLACQALVATHTGSPVPFLGLPVTRQGPVLMFSAEEPEAEIGGASTPSAKPRTSIRPCSPTCIS